MGLTPDDVEHKQFVRVMRGYDPAEVATFLRVIAAQMRDQHHAMATIADADKALDDNVVAVLRAAYEAAQIRTTPRRRPVRVRKASPAPSKSGAAEKRCPLRVAGR